jgi:SAM-dependent methyltransferase
VSEYRYEDFWPRVGDAYAGSDPLAAVCWDGAPAWFNRFFAHFQVRAVERAMRSQFGDGRRSGRALDLGCGAVDGRALTGGGANRSASIIARMLAAAMRHPYLQSDIARLPFASAACGMALSVTVLLHLPYDARARGARAARCLKPDALSC